MLTKDVFIWWKKDKTIKVPYFFIKVDNIVPNPIELLLIIQFRIPQEVSYISAVGGSCTPILWKIVGVLNPFKRFLVMDGIPITPKYQWRRSHVRCMIDGKGETLIPQTVYHSLLSLLTQNTLNSGSIFKSMRKCSLRTGMNAFRV